MFPTDSKILVVDDMSTMRKLVKKLLADLGYKDVAEAVDGQDAWNKIEDSAKQGKPFHVCISDWNMPKMKGIDLVKKIRSQPKTKSMSILLLTAEADKDQMQTGLQAGADGYLLKPFTKDDLATKLKLIAPKKAA